MMFARGVLFIALIVLGFASHAFAQPPVVVEFFGKNTCADDIAVQEHLQDILKSETDVILLNCRTWHDDVKEIKSFTHKFCNERYQAYNKNSANFLFNPPAPVIVNGHWKANRKDILPAIRAARGDKVRPIAVSSHDGGLNISLPAIMSDIGFGEILLYVYVPTQDKKAVFIDPDLDLTDAIREKIRKNQSVPFVTKARTTPFYLRPILAMEQIGHWRGEQMDFTFPLNDVTALTGSSHADLSYVVVLHGDNRYGQVLAAGEHISLAEIHNTLPHSEAETIEFSSRPNQNKP